jgi:hypothetical protein
MLYQTTFNHGFVADEIRITAAACIARLIREAGATDSRRKRRSDKRRYFLALR